MLGGLLIALKKFIFSLTIVKVSILGVKRYFIDHVVSKNLQSHFFSHIKNPIKKWWQGFDVRKKLLFFIPASVVAAISLYLAGIGKLLNFLGIKTLIISFFKGLWLIFAKVFTFFTVQIWTTWFAPILEVLIFSWLLALAEKVPVLKTIFNKVYTFIGSIFSRTGAFLDRFINNPVQKRLNRFGKLLALYIRKKNRKLQQLQLQQNLSEDRETPVDSDDKNEYSRKD